MTSCCSTRRASPRAPRCADLVRRADLADQRLAGGAARLGDRHRAGHRGRRRAASARRSGRWRRRSAPNSVFSAVLVVALGLAAFAARLPEAEAPERQACATSSETILTRPILLATAFVAIPSVMFGAVEVLVPLQIDDLGGGHALIAGWLHRRRRAGGGPGPAGRALLGSGRAARALHARAQHLRGGDGGVAIGAADGRRDGRLDPHFARRRASASRRR